MAKIIPLDKYRDLTALRAGFKYWKRRFKENFDARTGLSELSAATLSLLAEPGDESTTSLCSLIIAFLGYGSSETFDSLPTQIQCTVLDIHLFMADQIRFEMMHRLGWLDRFAGRQFSLFEMVKEFKGVKQACQERPPQLAKDHPGWSEYRLLVDRDQQVFIRRMLPAALASFRASCGL